MIETDSKWVGQTAQRRSDFYFPLQQKGRGYFKLINSTSLCIGDCFFFNRKVTETVQRVLTDPTLSLPTVNILGYYGTFVTTKEPTLIRCY